MNPAIRRQLLEAAKDVQTREIFTFLYRDHPQGSSCETLKQTLFLPESFDESCLQPFVEDNVLVFDGKRYKIAADARQVLDRDPTILMDEFLR